MQSFQCRLFLMVLFSTALISGIPTAVGGYNIDADNDELSSSELKQGYRL